MKGSLHMCNAKEFAGTDIPAGTFDALHQAWINFKADPSDWALFDELDWAAKLFAVRMDSYATSRRCAAGAKWRKQSDQDHHG
jgi:hypothetical protein